MQTKKQTSKLAIVSMLCAISTVLFFMEIPILPSMGHLKLDFSDIPALFASITYGPIAGITIEFIKNLIGLMTKGLGEQMGFGNIMNFIVGVAYILPFSLIYNKLKSKQTNTNKALIISSIVGVISILAFGFGGNYIIAPWFFEVFLKMQLTSEILWGAIWSATALNVIKGIMLSVLSFPIVKILVTKLMKFKV